jgi:hypothetical protein
MQQNSANYGIGGATALTFGTDFMSVPGVDIVAGNMFSSAFYGEPLDSTKAATAVSPDLLLKGMGEPLTYGRRTSQFLSTNLVGKGGLPKALSESTGVLKASLEPVSKGVNLGLEFGERVAVDTGLFGGEVVGCVVPQSLVIPVVLRLFF